MATTMAPATVDETLAQIRRRIAVAMRRHKLDDRAPRHVEAFIRSDPAFDSVEKLATIKPLELERWVINGVEVLDNSGGASRKYDEKAAALGIPEFVYVEVFTSLRLL